MGTKRVGLARVQTLIENLKREIKLNGANSDRDWETIYNHIKNCMV